jgi:tryptophan synthase alpha chain
VVIGFGISTPAQAVEACQEADGVVVASALIRRLLDGGGPDEAAAFVTSLREALDRG